jgi:ornithine cyclodeaminase
LARPEARVGAVLGAGAQARTQAIAIDAVRQLNNIRIYSPTAANVQRLIAEVQPEVRARLVAVLSPDEALREADIVCTATTSATPVFDGHMLQPGAHVNGVGSFMTHMQEVDTETVRRARIFVDSRESALAEAGDLVIPMQAGVTRPDDWTEIGQVVAGLRPGRQSPDDITFFKSVGVAVQDVAAAARALAEARVRGLGREVQL